MSEVFRLLLLGQRLEHFVKRFDSRLGFLSREITLGYVCLRGLARRQLMIDSKTAGYSFT
jgi:hypothetical protein